MSWREVVWEALFYLFIYLLCKSYQGTRKIMQKNTKVREKQYKKHTKSLMHLNFSNLRPCTRMYSIQYKSRIRIQLKYRYGGKRSKIESRTGVSDVNRGGDKASQNQMRIISSMSCYCHAALTRFICTKHFV